jgi:hypothetical protein
VVIPHQNINKQQTELRNMSTETPQLLDTLRAAYLAKNCPVDDYLQPGLTPEQIVSKTRQLGLTLPADLVQLYTWRNGQTDEAEDASDAFVFRDNIFINLERAIAEYAEVLEYNSDSNTLEDDGVLLKNCFPFAAFQGSWYLVVCGPHRLKTQSRHPVICVYEGMDLFFHSIDSMVKTCTEWVNHPSWAPASSLDYNLELGIWKKHNPGVFE